jgi:hypothetical protein
MKLRNPTLGFCSILSHSYYVPIYFYALATFGNSGALERIVNLSIFFGAYSFVFENREPRRR